MFSNFFRFVGVAGLLVAAALPAQARDLRSYFFGNSLVNHQSDTVQTSVLYWLTELTDASNHTFAASGQYGFLRNFAQDLPPLASWGLGRTAPAWEPEQGPFSDSGIQAVILTPANFIQYQRADRPYDGDNPTNTSPLQASLSNIDWVAAQLNGEVFYIYEGWADMSSYARSQLPKPRQLARYHAYNQGDYHKWYKDYLAALKSARPDLDIRLIPVAKTLSALFTKTPLKDIPVEALYTDNAPHGTPTLYFLASLVVYHALYGDRPPEDFIVPETVHPLVRVNYPKIREFIASGNFVADKSPVPVRVPSLAMGLNGIADWSTQQPFIDVMKTARAWIGHLPGQWGGWSADDLHKGGYLDENGWPLRIPDALASIETLILTDQPVQGVSTAGRYRLTYEGRGRIELTGRVQQLRRRPGEIWFTYTPGEGLVGIEIRRTDPRKTGNYIRNIVVVKEENIPLYQVGELFNPLWLDRIRDLRSVRFMDWMFTNGSTIRKWSDRPKPAYYTYGETGVPVEIMVALANEIGADPWFNMPHMADENYNRRFAQYVVQHLNPQLKTYVEYSNELWNFMFPQAQWSLKRAEKRWGSSAGGDAWLQFAALRAARAMDIWSNVYGVRAKTRLVRVVATHTDWPGLEEAILQAPLVVAEGNPAPVGSFDAYAVTGYFGFDLGTDDLAPAVLEWIAQSRKTAERRGRNDGLGGQALKTFIANHKYDAASRKAAENIREGSLNHLLTEALPYQAGVARDNGLMLVMYEGGTHVVGTGEWASNDRLGAFFEHFNYTKRMAGLYNELLTGWKNVGGTLFNAFVDVAPASKWGSWGALRYLDDTNPRWNALMVFNRNNPAWWSNRPAQVFADGVFLTGSKKGETLTGTPKQDILLGKAGNDKLISLGGSDKLHGGAGDDWAQLPRKRAEYRFERVGDLLRAIAGREVVNLYSIEAVSFADRPSVRVLVSEL
jgi:hypothetical protein